MTSDCPHVSRSVTHALYVADAEVRFKVCLDCGRADGTIALAFGPSGAFTWSGLEPLNAAIERCLVPVRAL